MKKLLTHPCIPNSKVKLVAVSEDSEEIIHALNKIGIEVYKIKKNIMLEPSISSHADCAIVQLDSQTILADISQCKTSISEIENTQSNDLYNILVNYLTSINGENAKRISKCQTEKTNITDKTDKSYIIINDCLHLKIVKNPIKSPYPNDVMLNIRILDNKILCNTLYVADEIKKFASDNNYELIHCNQGYVGCSSIAINSNAIITDDNSIHRSCTANGIDSVELSKGSIKLSGHDYGFIGGCCGMIDKNVLAFTGRIENHPDYNLIKKFLDKYEINYVNLTDNELTDIGGIIPLIETT